ncbi:Asp-tRNA(Asn)/Glu-tRNA(Gln) amidotransferase subunit GatC [Sulfurimonas microaerophilic]|uniref:Asp-tRNA(Asn)/Glu-tRNA(Gln) amidotransferase subunit GatC n=1 Tax=Sulfurimonas microaerophilic TaxID=3058392 RepID=UPI0027149463|nr:Asp-tRNA(Asn)/Glu-tRNA(Gln) amidotransferase subunit GatC [Sulfurimonas sp. hsl 1-7]
MQVDDKLLSRLEKLSYLKVSEDKRAEIVEQLSEIVSFVDNLSELDTAGIESTFAMNDNATPLREDVPSCDTNINDDILRHAPDASEHFFIVPKIIE